MNKERRKELDAAIGELQTLAEKLEGTQDQEQEAFDNLPESLQEGERGQAMQEAIDAMQEARDSIESAVDNLEAAKG